MENIVLPKIKLNIGINNIIINSNVSPSYFKIKYNKAETGTIEEEITTDEYFENKPNNIVKPISAITLRSSEVRAAGQTVYDDELIEQYGVNELIIEEDYFAYTDTLRNQYLEAAKALFGLTYKPLEVNVLGSVYLDFNDIIKVINPQGEEYLTYSLNNNHEYNGVLYNTISIPSLSEVEEKYKYETEDKTLRRKTAIEIDKANQRIQSLVSEIGDRSQKETSITQDIDRLEILVDNIEDLTAEVTGINPITLPDCIEGSILDFRIIGNNTVFSGLTPAENLVPSNSLYPRGASRIFVKHYNDEDELVSTDVYSLKAKAPLRQYSTTIFDEFRYSFDVEEEESKAKIIRRVGVTAGGTLYPLAEEVVETVDIPDIMLTRGKNVIDIVSPYYANCYARYVLLNAFTDKFATTYELKSSIDILQGEIDIKVAEKVDKDEVIADINAAIVDHQAILRLTGNQVIINSDNFQLAADGSINATNGTFSGWIDATSGRIGRWTLNQQGVLYGSATLSGNTYQSGMDTRNNDIAFYTGLDITDGQSHYLTEANVYITKSGTIHANKFHGNVDSGYFRLDYDSGRRALWLGDSNIYYYIDDQNNSFFGGLSRNNRGFTFELLSGYFFSIHDYLHNISIAEFYRQDDVGNAGYINLFMKTWYYAGGTSGYEVATKNDICDKNVKKNIKESSKNALDIVNKIQFKQFDWDEKKIDRKGHIDVGVIAQQLKELDENYVEETVIKKENKEEKVYTINNLNLLSTALKAIQELSEKVESLEEEIRKLKGEK